MGTRFATTALLASLVAVACSDDGPGATLGTTPGSSGGGGSSGVLSPPPRDGGGSGSNGGDGSVSTPRDDAGDGVIVAALVPTRVSGPAPLAVQFDAIATTHADSSKDTFRELEYAFDYGDPGSGNWAGSTASKNVQIGGPLGAHVFDTPGTYTVAVTASEGSSRATKTVTITVESADAHWPAAQTIVVSPTGNFAEAPAGAEQRTSLPSSYDGKRVLLHRGESFGAIDIRSSDDDVQVGAYGTGAKPRVQGVALGTSADTADWPDEITIVDLKILSGAFGMPGPGSRILLYRSEIDTPSQNESQIDIGTATAYYVEHGTLPASSYYWPREVFLVDNKVEGNTDGDGLPTMVCMGFFARSALLGNTMNKATQHTLRMWWANRVLIAHNTFGGEHYAPNPPGIRGAIKIHSGGVSPYDDNIGTSGLTVSTRYLLVANNTIGSKLYPGSWTSGAGPQNIDPGTVEAVIDVIFENNGFLRGPYTTQDVHMLAQRATTRGNFAIEGGEFNGDVVRPGETDIDPAMNPYLGPYFGQLTQ